MSISKKIEKYTKELEELNKKDEKCEEIREKVFNETPINTRKTKNILKTIDKNNQKIEIAEQNLEKYTKKDDEKQAKYEAQKEKKLINKIDKNTSIALNEKKGAKIACGIIGGLVGLGLGVSAYAINNRTETIINAREIAKFFNQSEQQAVDIVKSGYQKYDETALIVKETASNVGSIIKDIAVDTYSDIKDALTPKFEITFQLGGAENDSMDME